MSRTALLRIGALVVLAVLMVVLFVTGLMADFATVVLFYLYRGWRVALSVPQPVYWAVLIGLALMVIFTSFEYDFIGADEDEAQDLPSEGRVATLTRWVRQADRGMYFRRRLARRLLEITLEAHGYNPAMSERRVLHLMAQGELDLPPDLERFLRAGMVSADGAVRPESQLERTRRAYLNRGRVPPEVEPIIEHLEERVG